MSTEHDVPRIPGYTIQRFIGEGANARVYLALQESLNRQVALKILQKFDQAEQTQRFFNEGRIIASMSHPNIITIYDIGHIGHQTYLAMEYLDGGSLRKKLDNPLAPVKALKIIHAIANALYLIHKKGIVHRDVKPENILFSRQGLIKLTDFGIAKNQNRDMKLTMDGTALGSPYYLSPEQAQGKPLDGRSDIYSLGVIFFEMLTGHPPYRGDSQIDVILGHLNKPVPTLPDSLQHYQSLLEKMMAKDPGQRFSSARELVKYVAALRKLNKAQAKKPPPTPPKATDFASKRRLLALNLLLFLAVVALLVLHPPFSSSPMPTAPSATQNAIRQAVLPSRPASTSPATDNAAPTTQFTPEDASVKMPVAASAPLSGENPAIIEIPVSKTTLTAQPNRADKSIPESQHATNVPSATSENTEPPQPEALAKTQEGLQATTSTPALPPENTELPQPEALKIEDLQATSTPLDSPESTEPPQPEALLETPETPRATNTPLATPGNAQPLQPEKMADAPEGPESFQSEETPENGAISESTVSVQTPTAPGHASTSTTQATKMASNQPRIDTLLAQAENALKAYRLTNPKNDSAYHYYRQVLKIDPQNAQAHRGLGRIVARYAGLAERALQKGNETKARTYVTRGLRVQPRNTTLLALQQRLDALEQARNAPKPPPTTTTANPPTPQQPKPWFKPVNNSLELLESLE